MYFIDMKIENVAFFPFLSTLSVPWCVEFFFFFCTTDEVVICGVRGGRIHWWEKDRVTGSALAFFPSRFNAKKIFDLTHREGKKRKKEEENGLELERVHARYPHLRLTLYATAQLGLHIFSLLFLKSLNFSGCLSWIFVYWSIFFLHNSFLNQKESCPIFIYVEIKHNDLQGFIDNCLWFSAVL